MKAKLVEMGSGGNSGYIDDELPDYVMIMVANKRSKSQMTEDLGLFLGDNTAEFVEWLHQVLQKLQEVAIPASAVVQKSSSSSSKRKPTSSESKKDKKKKSKRDQHEDGSTTPPTVGAKKAIEVSAGTATPSITDVFAEHLIQKARSTMSVDKVKTKDECDVGKIDDFDIPTISEMTESVVITNNRRKDLSTLADLQKKINQAKRQLRTFGSADDESEDEDFINIKDDDDLGDADEDNSGSPKNNTAVDKQHKKPQRIPITFQEETLAAERREQAKASETSDSTIIAQKRTVMDRLGSKQTPSGNRDNIISLSANRRMEKEIYVPAFRRNEDNRHQPSRDARESSREDRSNRDSFRDVNNPVRTNRDARDRPRESTFRDSQRLAAKRDYPDKAPPVKHSLVAQRDLREQVREKQNKAKKELDSLRPKRISDAVVSSKKSRSMESRVFVAPPKPAYDENVVEVPVNSVVKVQPRPVVASNKQACKNLLLRAVAEARKSTASVKPREESPKRRKPTDALLANQPKLFSKSFRDKVKHNIVIELDTAAGHQFPEEDDSSEVEYVVDDIGCHEIEDDTEEDDDVMENDDDDDFTNGANAAVQTQQNPDPDAGNDTQFVVTLDDMESKKYAAKAKIAKAAKKLRRSVETNANNGMDDMDNEDSRSSMKVNKLIIKNDTDDEEELMNEVKRSTQKNVEVPVSAAPSSASEEPPENSTSPSSRRTKRRHVSPIKFDLKKVDAEEDKEESATSTKRHRNSHERSSSAPRRRSEERSSESSKVATKRSESSRKYDHLPSRKFDFYVFSYVHLLFAIFFSNIYNSAMKLY